MITFKNIIFDLHGVIFRNKLLYDETISVEPIPEGVDILNKCYFSQRQDIVGKYNILSCTNWSRQIIKKLENYYPDIMLKFNGIVTPTESYYKKPQVQMFNYLINSYNLIPEETLFIDDLKINIESANKVGLYGKIVTNFQELNEFLIKNKIY